MKFLFILAWYFPSILIAQELLIRDVTIISPERNKPFNNASVRIVDNRIIEVSSSQIAASKGSMIIDGQGKYLIPGLMDSHVHVSSMPGLPSAGIKKGSPLWDMQQAFYTQQPRSYLYFGVTQLLDLSQSKQSIVRFNNAVNRPDLFHCGAIPILEGYPAVFSDKQVASKMFEYFVIDDSLTNDPNNTITSKEHSPEAVVQRIANDGAICVKVFIENGFGSADHWPMISQNLLNRIKNEAKKYNLLVVAHANAIDMQKIAIELEVDVIAHGMWNWNEFDGDQSLPSSIQLILDKIINQNIDFQHTFNVMDGLRNVTVSNILDSPLYRKVVSDSALKWYMSKPGQWFKEEIISEFDGLPLAKVHEQFDKKIVQGERVVEYLYKKGHPMILASDTPSSPTYAAQPGLSTFQEITHLAKIGISLIDIFKAATINNANAFGLEKDYGTIEPGKIANLLLLTKNPLKSISAYNSIDKVILHGQPIDRNELRVQQK